MKSKAWLAVLVVAALFEMSFGSGQALARVDSEGQLDKIYKELTEIHQEVRALAEGQKKLSEEHKQLRYFVHKK